MKLRAFLSLIALCAAVLVGAFPAWAEDDSAHTITSQKGIEKFVTMDFPVRRLSIGDTKIADVTVIDGNTLRIVGLDNGKTTFSLWREGSDTPVTYTLVIAPKVVQVDVEVIAVSRSALRELGLNFSDLGSGFSIATSAPSTMHSFTFNAGGTPGLQTDQSSPIADAFNLLLGSPHYNVLAVISALQNADYSETLARPTLVVRSGEKANFLVGGEVPIPVPQGNAGSIAIQYKRFGVGLSVEPEVLDGSRIALKIKPSVSELDYSNAVTLGGVSVPALRTREAETDVEVDAGEPLLLAGLNYDTGSGTNEKVPYLADIPMLGEFFKRRSQTHEEQELIIAVTPHIVSAETQDRSFQDIVVKDYNDVLSSNASASALHAKPAGKSPGSQQ